jgi:hypothetical protein
MPNADTTTDWTGRLHELAARERVPGAALGVWADGHESAAEISIRHLLIS